MAQTYGHREKVNSGPRAVYRYDQAMTPKRPHRVAVLGLPSLIPLELGIATEVFGREPHYDVTVCAEGGVARGVGPGITVTTSAGLNVLREADTVIVPGYEDLDATLSAAVLDALRLAHGRGARLVSICTGAFAVAAAGLLDGRHATTHWLWTDELQRRHPLVEVLPNRLFVDDGDILTSAGMTTGIDLCLHLIRRDHGAAAANSAARVLVAPPQRQGGQAHRGHGRSARAASRLDAGEPCPSARPRHARGARAHVSTHAHSSVPRGDRGRSYGLAHRCADRPSTRAAGDDHRADRKHRPPHGPGRAGICSSGLPSAHRHLAEGIPGRLPPPRTHVDVINTQAPSQQRSRVVAGRRSVLTSAHLWCSAGSCLVSGAHARRVVPGQSRSP
jgi:putative intracellular protease/amidase